MHLININSTIVGEEISGHHLPKNRDTSLEPRRFSSQYAETPIRVLEGIASKCRANVI